MKLIKALIITWSLTTQAGLPPTTLSGQSASTKPTTFSTKVPYNQATKLNGTESLIETGNENMLINPSFEAATGAEWVCIGTACALTNTSSEISSGKAALSIAPAAGAFQLYQNVNVPSGIQKQGVVGILYKLSTNCSTAVISSLVDGVVQTSVPSSNLIFDSKYHRIEIPITFGATSAGIQAQAVSGCTGTLFFDAAYVKQGIGFQNLMLDNTYSAQVSATGVVSGENKNWINGNAVIAATSNFDMYFNSGIFTTAPNCTFSPVENTGGVIILNGMVFTSSIATSVVTYVNSVRTAQAFNISCQKSGNDYLASSANVYSQASANYDWTAYTPTYTSLGSVTTTEAFYTRVGGNMYIKGRATLGITVATAASISIPLSLTVSSVFETSTALTGGSLVNNSNTGNYAALATGGESSISFGNVSTPAGLSKAIGTNIGTTGQVISWFVGPIPISGWSTSNVIVGSFAGVPAVPGYQGNVDTFSVSYGATISTACASASGVVCPYVDSIGVGFSVIHGATVGQYNLTLPKTYTKLKCTGSVNSGGNGGVVPFNNPSQGPSCSNCNSLLFYTGDPSVFRDTYGTIMCQGSF